MDLPMPGSPPIRMLLPFIAPPPRTLSNSTICVENLVFSSALIELSGFTSTLTTFPDGKDLFALILCL